LNRGCIPFYYPHAKPAEGEDVEARFHYAMTVAQDIGLAQLGDTVAFAYGWQTGVASLANFRLITVGSQLSRAITIPPPALMELCDFAHPELFTVGAAPATAPQVRTHESMQPRRRVRRPTFCTRRTSTFTRSRATTAPLASSARSAPRPSRSRSSPSCAGQA